MHQKFANGSHIHLQGLDCYIPPVGYGYDQATGELVKCEILKRSPIKEEQYWERSGEPEWFAERWAEQKRRKKKDPNYSDPKVYAYVKREWDRRLYGVWFLNNGEPTYITGLYYFYLQWWYIGKTSTGYPDYRERDLHFFYFLQVVLESNWILGMLYMTKRREGKTAKSGVFVLEPIMRQKDWRAGVQSKTIDDAKNVVFRDAIVKPFRKLPEFFRPIYDQSGGLQPKKELSFSRTNLRRELTEEEALQEDLNSAVDWRSGDVSSYDGYRLERYVGDEVAKPKDVDVWERHLTNKYCAIDSERQIIGKMLYTTTVEEAMQQNGFRTLFEKSDLSKRNPVNRQTPSGLVRYFLPADEAGKTDKYGKVNVEQERALILAERAEFEHDARTLSSLIRKNPLTVEEAMRISGDKCLFNDGNIYKRLDCFIGNHNFWDRGNFDPIDPDDWSRGVKWNPSPSGRFRVSWLPDEPNLFKMRGNKYISTGKHKFCMGVDPFSHKLVEVDNQTKRSDAGAYVYRKFDILDEEGSDKPVAQYLCRPSSPETFYRDMALVALYYGAEVLFENQHPVLGDKFIEWGMQDFLIYAEGKANPGIAGSQKAINTICDHTAVYVENHCHKVPFEELLTDWLTFDPTNTQPSDATMAFGYTLIAASIGKKNTRVSGGKLSLSSLIPKLKLA